MQIALVLSHLIGVPLRLNPRSQSCSTIHNIREQHVPSAIYSASVVDTATEFCFIEFHEIKDDPKS